MAPPHHHLTEPPRLLVRCDALCRIECVCVCVCFCVCFVCACVVCACVCCVCECSRSCVFGQCLRLLFLLFFFLPSALLHSHRHPQASATSPPPAASMLSRRRPSASLQHSSRCVCCGAVFTLSCQVSFAAAVLRQSSNGVSSAHTALCLRARAFSTFIWPPLTERHTHFVALPHDTARAASGRRACR